MSTPTRVMDLEAWKHAAQEGRAPADAVLHKDVESEVRALDPKTRQVRFRITTGAVDRMKDTIDPTGWDLKNWKANPVFLWAHQYGGTAAGPGLPIAKGVDIAADAKGLTAVAQFATRDQYEFADTVYQLILGGFLKATSVGFKPLKHVYNEQRGGVDFLQQELLEVSVVPIPANPEALIEGKAIDLSPLRSWLDRQDGGRTSWRGWRADVPIIILDDEAENEYVLILDEEVKFVPANVSTEREDSDASWTAPSLADFGRGGRWADLSASDRRFVAGHYAWVGSLDDFATFKLPHHNPRTGKVNLHGVNNALARLPNTDVPPDETGRVEAHLKSHQASFKGLYRTAHGLVGIAEDGRELSTAELRMVVTAVMTDPEVAASIAEHAAETARATIGRLKGDADYSPTVPHRRGRR